MKTLKFQVNACCLTFFCSFAILLALIHFYTARPPTSTVKPSRQLVKQNRSSEDTHNTTIIKQTSIPIHRVTNRFINISTNWVSHFENYSFNHFDATQIFSEATCTKEICYNHIYKSGGTTILYGLNQLMDENKFINLTLYYDPNQTIIAKNANGNHFVKLPIDNYLHFIYNSNCNCNSSSNSNCNFNCKYKSQIIANNNFLLFTFVRDPIDKFLSAFYEIHRRLILKNFCLFLNLTVNNNYNTLTNHTQQTICRSQKSKKEEEEEKTTLEDKIRNKKAIPENAFGLMDIDVVYSYYKNDSTFRLLSRWIDLLYDRNSVEMIEKIRKTKHKNDFNQYYFNPHNWPNIAFLNKKMQFEFIGNLNNIVNDLKIILKPYFRDKYLLNNTFEKDIDQIFDKSKHEVKRDRHGTVYVDGKAAATGANVVNDNYNTQQQTQLDPIIRRFSFERSQLSDNDIFKLCNIFWLDFICFPFEIPLQCDWNQLKERYGLFFQSK